MQVSRAMLFWPACEKAELQMPTTENVKFHREWTSAPAASRSMTLLVRCSKCIFRLQQPLGSVFQGSGFPRGWPSRLAAWAWLWSRSRSLLFPQPLPVSRLCPPHPAPAPVLADPSTDTGPRALGARKTWRGAMARCNKGLPLPPGSPELR